MRLISNGMRGRQSRRDWCDSGRSVAIAGRFFKLDRPWVIAIAGAILIVFGLIYQFGGVSMDHPQNNPAAIDQPAKPAPPTTSPKLPAPIPQ